MFKEDSVEFLKLIEKYLLSNSDLKEYYQEQWKIYNPNLKVDFFRQIDSEEKSYWYGFMCSDGSITKGKDLSHTRYQISIELSVKDKEHLIKFCNRVGLNPNKIGERTKILKNKPHRLAYIIFTCKPMFEDIENLGFIRFKEGKRVSLKLGDNNLSYS